MPGKKTPAKASGRPAMGYDVLDTANTKKRRIPKPERKSEDNNRNQRQKLVGSALGRDMQRNQAGFATIVRQFQIGAVGTGPKLVLNSPSEEFNSAASEWFNSDWAKWCDGTDDNHFADLVAMALGAEKREGDILAIFDDFLRDDGRLIFRESDQIIPIDDVSWKKAFADAGTKFPWVDKDPKDLRRRIPMTQENGTVRDSFGRVVAYICTNEHGLSTVNFDKATIIPRWDMRSNKNGSAKLFKRPWRFNQLRGIGDAITIASLQTDIYEMFAAELQSAKVAAQNVADVKVDAEGESGIARALEAAGATEDQIDKLLYGDGEGLTGVAGRRYDALEAITGGRVNYLNPGEEINYHANERPSESVSKFTEYVQQLSGAALGLGRSRATLKAETSYTAFRGEELMSWAAFEVDQKNLERRLVDWIAYKALSWGLSKREIKVEAPTDWHKNISWIWPTMREVDEVRTANAERIRMKNGSLDLGTILGPNWRKKMAAMAEQLNYARELGLPLSVFETVAGAETTAGEDQPEEETDKSEK